MSMFCYQCEQTAGGTGCTVKGVCGKDETTAVLQDLIVHAVKGIGQYAARAATLGERDVAIDHFVVQALFTTVTNVDFDPERLEQWIARAASVRDRAKALYEAACAKQDLTPDAPEGPAAWQPAAEREGLLAQGRAAGIDRRREVFGETTAGLQELALYGLKGAAAYIDHALVLGKDDPELMRAFHELLDTLAANPQKTEDLLAAALKAGEINMGAMALLDAANTEAYGHPEPTEVRITPKKGKAIVVSGHDLKDLEALLEQTKGTGIQVYTHGEMLPANAYPAFKKYDHLAGNYGGAWQDQQREFDEFPGAILMTTNCIQKPRASYRDRIFTSGIVAWPGVTHIAERDFSPVIEAAKAAPGFPEAEPEETILIGFARNAILGAADKVVELVKEGKLRHFFLIGGCDGARPGRNYYTDFAQAVPDDCAILTLACGKYRFNKLRFGTIDGIPRLLDCGQCNDAYSAIQVAVALADAFGCGVNDLPLSLVLSWYEQKAVAILLTLLHLGIQDIRLGPTLPAFVTEPVLQVLVDNYGIKPVTTPEEDLKAILGQTVKG